MRILPLLLSAIVLSTGPAMANKRPYILGVHPYLQEEELLQRFALLADCLAKALKRPVRVKVATSYDEHVDAIGRDALDIAFLGPASYIKLVDRYGPKPLLSRLEIRGKPHFKGAIIVRQESDIHAHEQLRDRSFAFGDKNSTMSTLVPMAMLQDAGINPDDLRDYRYYKGHNNIALAVLMGEVDAGAVKEEIYHKYRSRGLRKIMDTIAISEHLFVTRSNMSDAEVAVLRRTMHGLNRDAEKQKALDAIKPGVTGLVPVNDSDYDNLRKIKHQYSAPR